MQQRSSHRIRDKSLAGVTFACAELFGAVTRYGHGICDKASVGRRYTQVMSDIKAVLNTSDEYRASNLISQEVNDPRPAPISRSRDSAAQYRPPSTAGG